MKIPDRRKRRAYIEILLPIFILFLFLTAHYLAIIYRNTNVHTMWMGIKVDAFIGDFVLYLAIFLTFVLFILILHRNFIVRKKRGKRRY